MKLELPEEALEALRTLLDLGADRIVQISDLIEAGEPTLAPPGHRATYLSDALEASVPASTVEKVLKEFVYPGHDIRYRFDISAGELHAAMTDASRTADGDAWPTDYFEKWNNSKDAVLRLLGNRRLLQEAKARALLETRPNRVRELSVLTDVRPVFDKSGDELYFNILTHTLCVRFRSDNRNSVMYFSLDSEDLDELESQIKRAKRKGKTVDNLHESMNVPVLKVQGDDRDSETSEGSSQ